jgi:hypothetical protein
MTFFAHVEASHPCMCHPLCPPAIHVSHFYYNNYTQNIGKKFLKSSLISYRLHLMKQKLLVRISIFFSFVCVKKYIYIGKKIEEC